MFIIVIYFNEIKQIYCFQCAYYQLGQIYHQHSKLSVFVDTKWGSRIRLVSDEINCRYL